MNTVSLDQAVPDFTLPATGGKTVSLSDYRDGPLVLYFYPKASTPGCTQEGQDFRDLYQEFRALGADVLGASRDSVKAQQNFKDKYAFPFELLSDTDETLCSLFDVIHEKNMYGRKVMGIERSTFLIDADGVLRREWRKVKVKGHAAEVLAAVREL
ncbi:MAG: peroxiredoxin [Ectothiorhodospiraceae bacterium]|nr:peroxiredoxin [Ectothiorhodospiraceae bacterium]